MGIVIPEASDQYTEENKFYKKKWERALNN